MASHHKKASTFDPREVKENIVDTPLNEEMSHSFLEYAYSVIYARALPDARDGLKPVQRRIVYQMGEMNLSPDRAYMKSARVVGEVMGKLHPHGDSAIYDAMVRLAQPFSLRLPLVDGHGNFGSLDDGPAASRYTEARLAPAALAMNANIAEETVEFVPNYDNKLSEPTVLPAAIPNLLVNGSTGIAVGMATNMVTHNLTEVVEAAKHLMAHPDAQVDELMEYIPGPDLPGGGIIIGRAGIREAYESGHGAFVTRARTHIENVTARKKGIIVTELPFMVGPEKVLERISDGVKNKKLDGIAGAMDLSDRHNGLRMVIEIKSGFNPEAVLAGLFKYTPLQESFTINNVALVDGRPHTMGLKELLQVWIDHRRHVIGARSDFRIRKAKERLHLVDGLLLALIDIDEVIEVIRSSQDADAARTRLMAVFDLDEIQANYILDLRLRRLTRMSRVELEAESDELRKQIDELQLILSSSDELDRVVVSEMDDVTNRYGTPRRTLLLEEDGQTVSSVVDSSPQSLEDVEAARGVVRHTAANISVTTASPTNLELTDEPCAVLLSADGRIGRSSTTALDIFAAREASTPRGTNDEITSIFSTTTRSEFGIITSAGRLVKANVSDLPIIHAEIPLTVAAGVQASEFLHSTQSTEPVSGERIVSAVSLDPQTPLGIGTRNGVVKRWNMDSPTTMDSWTVISLNAQDSDEVLFAAPAGDDDRLVFISSDSSLLTFPASQVRPQGRTSSGMAGIKLASDAHVVAFGVVPAGKLAWTADDGNGENKDNPDNMSNMSGTVVLTVAGDSELLPGTQNGAAKLTPLDLFPVKGRATQGVRSQRFLKGENTLLQAYVGQYPIIASSAQGTPVALPDIDMRRDGSGTELSRRIEFVS